ncbi:MAG: hypothetical protein KGP14_15215 [Betaproteobacteria bacterium]|nr:hypothetical protein [Betaproteobacteria bacterium]
MRHAVIAGLVALAAPTTAAFAADAPAVAKAAYSTADSDLGTLLDNPATKAVLSKYIAEMISNPQIDMARSMTLRQLQSYAGDKLTDDTLAKIDAELAKVPAK